MYVNMLLTFYKSGEQGAVLYKFIFVYGLLNFPFIPVPNL